MAVRPLRFLAEENCDSVIVRALRADGHDVLSLSEFTTRSDDRDIIQDSYREKRIFLTEDKDFGWLVYVSHSDSPGVVLIRFPANARHKLAESIIRLVHEKGDQIYHSFVVVQPGLIRIDQRPSLLG